MIFNVFEIMSSCLLKGFISLCILIDSTLQTSDGYQRNVFSKAVKRQH